MMPSENPAARACEHAPASTDVSLMDTGAAAAFSAERDRASTKGSEAATSCWNRMRRDRRTCRRGATRNAPITATVQAKPTTANNAEATTLIHGLSPILSENNSPFAATRLVADPLLPPTHHVLRPQPPPSQFERESPQNLPVCSGSDAPAAQVPQALLGSFAAKQQKPPAGTDALAFAIGAGGTGAGGWDSAASCACLLHM